MTGGGSSGRSNAHRQHRIVQQVVQDPEPIARFPGGTSGQRNQIGVAGPGPSGSNPVDGSCRNQDARHFGEHACQPRNNLSGHLRRLQRHHVDRSLVDTSQRQIDQLSDVHDYKRYLRATRRTKDPTF